MSGEFRQWASNLLDQQIWCWGRDISRPDGNILLDLGMCRHRSPGTGCTAYTGRVAGDGVVWLWGFGLMYCEPELGGVFLRRFGFHPMLVPGPPARPVHKPDSLDLLVRPLTSRQKDVAGSLLRGAAGWVARYEHWVAETYGSVYREATLRARVKKPPTVAARKMAAAWENLAKKSERLADSPAPARGPWGRLFASLRRPENASASHCLHHTADVRRGFRHHDS